MGVLFLPSSDAYVRSLLYLLYTLIKLYYTKTLSNQALSLAPNWILLLQRPTIPVSFRSAITFHLGGSSGILKDKVRMLEALVLCSPREHVCCCTLLTLRYACVNEWNALSEASEEPFFPVSALRFCGALIQLMAETCRGFTCQCQKAPSISFGDQPEMGKVCGPNSPFSVKLFGLWPFHNSLGIRSTNLIYQIIDFQGTCNQCCYCVLWLRSQTWIGSQEAPSLTRNRKFES